VTCCPARRADSIVATGFLVAGPYDEAGTSSVSVLLRAKVREEELEDMLAAVGQTFLGMTVNLRSLPRSQVRNPIPQRDYYRFKSVFEGVRHGDRPILTADEQRREGQLLTRIGREISIRESELAALERGRREKLVPSKAGALPASVPAPISRWTFDGDARDVIGQLHGTLRGAAPHCQWPLVLNGPGAFVETVPLTIDLRDKTLITPPPRCLRLSSATQGFERLVTQVQLSAGRFRRTLPDHSGPAAIGNAGRSAQRAVQLANHIAGIAVKSPAADRGRNRRGQRAGLWTEPVSRDGPRSSAASSDSRIEISRPIRVNNCPSRPLLIGGQNWPIAVAHASNRI